MQIRCPCVVQSFINHNARLYKLFVIGNKYYVVERPSLKNFQAGNKPPIHFDSHTISKPDSSSSIIELDDESQKDSQLEKPSGEIFDQIVSEFRDKLNLSLFGVDVIVEKGTGRHAIIDMNVFPGKKLLGKSRISVSHVIHVLLLCHQMIHEPNVTSLISFSTGYDGVPSFLNDLTDMISDSISEKELNDKIAGGTSGNSITSNIRNPGNSNKVANKVKTARPDGLNDTDSGIDTSDSCDEKKPKGERKFKSTKTIM